MNLVHIPQGNEQSTSRIFSRIVACIVFIAGLCWQYSQIDLGNKIQRRPVGEHGWAQIDRASMALSYYMDQPSFWLPRCHRAHRNPEGITAGEFPLIPYTVSKLYNLFGFHEWIHRVFILCLSITGYIFAFLLVERLIKNSITASLIALCWISSPNIVYYSISFLPDVASLSMLTISIYFLIGFQKPAWWNYLLVAVFLSLAGLLKLSALLPGIAVAMLYFFLHSRNNLFDWKLKLQFFAAIAIPLISCFAWTMYARHLLNTYHIFTFLMEFMPPNSWSDLKQGLLVTWQSREMYYSNSFLLFLTGSLSMALFFAKKQFRPTLLMAGLILFSAIPLYYVVFQKSTYHYYYWIPFQLGFLLLLVWICQVLYNINNQRWFVITTNLLLAGFIMYQSGLVGNSVNQRFNQGNPMYVAYYDLEPYLNSLEIGYHQKIATYSDPTYNNSLYLMNRKGWTLDTGTHPERLHEAFRNCDYAVLNDTTIINNDDFKHYFKVRVGNHRNLSIYKLPN